MIWFGKRKGRHSKIFKKNFQKKNFKKNFQKNSSIRKNNVIFVYKI